MSMPGSTTQIDFDPTKSPMRWSRQTLVWLFLITSLLAGASTFTFLKLRSVVEGFSEKLISNEVGEIVEKFNIVDGLLLDRNEKAIQMQRRWMLAYGKPRIETGVAQDLGAKQVPILLFGDKRATQLQKAFIGMAAATDSVATLFIKHDGQMVRLMSTVSTSDGSSAVGTILDPKGGPIKALLAGQPFRGPATILGEPYYTTYLPIFSDTGEVIGAWSAGYRISTVASTIRQSIEQARIQPEAYVAVLNDKGQVQFSSDGTPDSVLKNLKSQAFLSKKSSDFSAGNYLYNVYPYKPWDMKVVSITSRSALNDLAFRNSLGLLTLQVLTALAVVVLSWVFSRRLAKALESGDKARIEAEEANQAKSSFLANMSHELRTPMNAIIGYSEILIEECEEMEPEEIEQDLEKVLSSAKHLLGLINDVLDLSKIEAGKMTLYFETISLRRLMDEVIVTSRPLAEKNANTIELDFGDVPESDDQINVDITKLKQIILNLVSNACKFTEKGLVSIRSQFLPDEGQEFLIITVADSGIGMTEEQLARLFQDFSQADVSTTRKYGGTGLGLSLSRRFCLMMGGDITVTSQPGVGSQFTVRLPRQPAGAAQSDSSEEASSATTSLPASTSIAPISCDVEVRQAFVRARILLVDDDQNNSEIFKRFLVNDGFEVMHASSLGEGLKKASQCSPDLIIVDIEHSTMHGIDFLAKFKSIQDLKEIPVVMINMLENFELSYLLGASECLQSPIDWSQMEAVLTRLSSQKSSGKKDILIIEESKEISERLSSLLGSEQWTIRHFLRSRFAIDSVVESRPDLVILDLNAHYEECVAFLKALRQLQGQETLPLLILSDQPLALEILSLLNQQGSDCFTTNPDGLDALLKRIKQDVLDQSLVN